MVDKPYYLHGHFTSLQEQRTHDYPSYTRYTRSVRSHSDARLSCQGDSVILPVFSYIVRAYSHLVRSSVQYTWMMNHAAQIGFRASSAEVRTRYWCSSHDEFERDWDMVVDSLVRKVPLGDLFLIPRTVARESWNRWLWEDTLCSMSLLLQPLKGSIIIWTYCFQYFSRDGFRRFWEGNFHNFLLFTSRKKRFLVIFGNTNFLFLFCFWIWYPHVRKSANVFSSFVLVRFLLVIVFNIFFKLFSGYQLTWFTLLARAMIKISGGI